MSNDHPAEYDCGRNGPGGQGAFPDGDAREAVELTQQVELGSGHRPKAARTTVMRIAHNHTAMPCFTPSNRTIRPVT